MSAIVYSIVAALTLLSAQKVSRFSRAAAAILFLLPLLFTSRALATGGIFGPVDLAYTTEPLASIASRAGVGAVTNPSISDVYVQFTPWNDALRRAIARHQWPLWDPFEYCGVPLAGAAQSSPYHPITLLGFAVPLRQYFAFAASLMLLSAALSAFLLFREFVSTEIAALFGAAAWMCSTHLVFFAGTALVLASSVTPLVLLGARRIVREPGKRSAILLTIALLLVVLAGHPESVLHIVTFAIAYFLFELWSDRRGRLSDTLLCGVGAGVAALLLSAIFLLPIFDTIQQSEEYVHRALGYRQRSATIAQMGHRIAANFFPFSEGASGIEEPSHSHETKHGWLATAYAGSMLFAPAAFAIFGSRLRERWFFLGAVIAGIAIGIGVPGFIDVLSHLPAFSISVNDRMIAFATLAACALAAIGVDVMTRRLAATFAIVAIAVLLAAFLALLPADYVQLNASRALLPVVLAAVAIAALPRKQAALLLLPLLLLQRGGEARSLQPTLPSRAFYPPFPGLEVMRADEPFRIVGIGNVLPPQLSTHYGLEDIRGFQAMTFQRLYETFRYWCVVQPVWSNRVDRLEPPILSLMNTRFAIVPSSMQVPAGWIVRAKYPAYAIAENTRVLPRAFVPRNVKVTWDSLDDIGAIADFAEQSVVHDKDRHDYAPNGPGQVTIDRNAGGRMRLRVHMDNDGWVVVTNALWRGWRAYEHNRRVPLRFANHAFIGLHLSAGEHNVRFYYVPRSFVIGAWISGISWLLAIVYVAIPSSAMTFFMSFQTSFFALGVRRRYAGWNVGMTRTPL